jgi:hypothetical protein
MSGLLLFILGVQAMSAQAPGAPALWGGLSAGPYGVGWTVVQQVDSSRSLPGAGRARPVQVVVWYPARSSPSPASARMRVRDYVGLIAGERLTRAAEPGEMDSAIAALRSVMEANGVDSSAAGRWLSAPVAGERDAPAAQGRFPVVLIAQGNFHAAYHQAILAEYLTSHGYIVATTPSPTRITGPMTSDADVLPNARDQAADLRVALDVAAGRGGQRSRVAVVAHSFGARAALLFVLEGPGARGLVSLDGGIGTATARGWLPTEDTARLGAMRAPVLHFFETVEPEMKPDFTLLGRLRRTDRCLVEVRGMRHLHFTSLGPATGAIEGFAVGPATPDVLIRWRAVARGTLRFLDRALGSLGTPACPPADSTGGTVRHLPPAGAAGAH